MAALTLSQKSQMLDAQSFLDRVKVALISKAHYWNNITTPLVSDYNRRMQKRKIFGENTINGIINFQIKDYAAFILELYTTSTPDLNGDNQLSDAVLNNGTYQDPAYDYFAGAIAEDADEPIKWRGNN